MSAYRKKFSCETVLLKLVNDILWAMENKEVSTVVSMDLSAAFDIVDHDILLEVLEKQYGIPDIVRSWYEFYLRPRGFKVCIGEEYLEEITLNCSVPQGSCHGPFLYLAYSGTIRWIVEQGWHDKTMEIR